jgi:hypothetical protein
MAYTTPIATKIVNYKHVLQDPSFEISCLHMYKIAIQI